MSKRQKKMKRSSQPGATWLEEDEQRAEALLEDIKAYRPDRYEELMQMSEQERMKTLAEYCRDNRESANSMADQIMKQKMEDGEITPENAAGERAFAEMIAREMAQEQFSQIYR